MLLSICIPICVESMCERVDWMSQCGGEGTMKHAL